MGLAPTSPFLVCFLPPSLSTRHDEGTDSSASSLLLSALRTPRPLEPSCLTQEEALSIRPTLPSTPRPRSRGSSPRLVLHPRPTGLWPTCLQGGPIWAVVLPCRPSNGEVVPDRVCRHESGRLDSRWVPLRIEDNPGPILTTFLLSQQAGRTSLRSSIRRLVSDAARHTRSQRSDSLTTPATVRCVFFSSTLSSLRSLV